MTFHTTRLIYKLKQSINNDLERLSQYRAKRRKGQRISDELCSPGDFGSLGQKTDNELVSALKTLSKILNDETFVSKQSISAQGNRQPADIDSLVSEEFLQHIYFKFETREEM